MEEREKADIGRSVERIVTRSLRELHNPIADREMAYSRKAS